MNNKQSIFGKSLDWILETIYSEDKTRLYLFLILIFGIVLRLIAANNLMVGADDSHFATPAINFTDSGKLETWDQSTSLWYYLTDIAFKIFGINQISSRFVTLIFGSLSILLIFLFSKEFFSKRTALLSALLVAISPWLIKNTLSEMDTLAMFFVLFSALLFQRGIKNNSSMMFVYSGIIMGLGFMTKAYTPMFAFALILYALFYSYSKDIKFSKIIKFILIFGLIASIFAAPLIINNYLLYKDKGFTDYLVSKTFGIGHNKSAEFFGGDSGWDKSTDLKGFILGNSPNSSETSPLFYQTLKFFFISDPLIFILFVIGFLMLLYKKDYGYIPIFLLLFVIPWVYIGSNQILAKHYLFMAIFATPIAANLIDSLLIKLNGKHTKVIIFIIIVFSLIYLGVQIGGSYYTYYHFYSESPQTQLMNYKQANIGLADIVILDERIYRGQDAWIFNDRFYLEAPLFINYMSSDKISQEKQYLVTAFFVECARGTCGWGVDPALNETMNQFTEYFAKNGKMVANIESSKGGNTYIPLLSNPGKESYFKVYSAQMYVPESIYTLSYKNKAWWSYPLGYDTRISPIFDNYSINGSLNNTLYSTAGIILKLAAIISALSVLYLIYLAFKD